MNLSSLGNVENGELNETVLIDKENVSQQNSSHEPATDILIMSPKNKPNRKFGFSNI